VKLLMQGFLPLDVFFVQPFDHFAGRSGAVVVGVVPIAEKELATGGWMIPDSPAAGFVAVVFAYQLIDAGPDRADDTELGEVRTESRPEAVIGTRLVHGPEGHSRAGGSFKTRRGGSEDLQSGDGA
jgi:hypothetical protein